MKNKFTFFAACFFAFHAQVSLAQDILYARKIIDTLTSPSMHGRGYINKGHLLAAGFIENEFKTIGLKPFDNKCRQEFPLSVNTFGKQIRISIDDTVLFPGRDYLVAPYSGTCNGTYPLIRFNDLVLYDETQLAKFLKENPEERAVVIDEHDIGNGEELRLCNAIAHTYNSPLIIIMREKLTWGLSEAAAKFAVAEILSNKISKSSSKIQINVVNDPLTGVISQNLIGFMPGKEIHKQNSVEHGDSLIVFTAHYDHLGMMGNEVMFPGANDNASGVAMLLSLAKHYSKTKTKYTTVFIAFGSEELGLGGSDFFVKNPLFSLDKIRFLINFDIVGTGDEGITVVNATIFDKEFRRLTGINFKNKYLERINERGPAANSDHYHFTQKNIPSFFIYTMGGIQAYHDIYDKRETLPLNEFEDLYRLMVEFVEGL